MPGTVKGSWVLTHVRLIDGSLHLGVWDTTTSQIVCLLAPEKKATDLDRVHGRAISVLPELLEAAEQVVRASDVSNGLDSIVATDRLRQVLIAAGRDVE